MGERRQPLFNRFIVLPIIKQCIHQIQLFMAAFGILEPTKDCFPYIIKHATPSSVQ